MTDLDTSQPDTSRPDLAHPATYAAAVPHAEFARRREQEPVSWVPEPLLWRHSSGGRIASQGSGFWAATTYEAVLSASRRPAEFSSAAKGVFLTDPRTPGDLRLTRQLLVNMDAPQHGRIRKLVTSVFTPRAVRELTASVSAHAEALVAKVVRAGDFDAVTDLGAELPLLVLSDLLGMPAEDRHRLYRWSNHLVGFDDPEYGGGDVDAYRATMAEAFSYALKLGQERREHPTGDLISLLANAEVDGERLSDREFVNFWLLLVVAGNETTRHAIAGSLQALADHPDQRERLVAGSVPVPTAVEELLRWITPIMQFRRTATRDTELCGQSIAEGEKVVLFYSSANRDPEVFDDPSCFDVGRDRNPHLGFGGGGPHFCLGRHLALLQLRTLLAELVDRAPAVRIDGRVLRSRSSFINGISRLPVRFS